MSDSKEIISMRRAQWQRAKGELKAFLEFFWPEYDPQNGKSISGLYEIADSAISDCIKTIEDNL